MNSWQPIATAPQDGVTKIIAGGWSEDRNQSTIAIVKLEPLHSEQGDRTKPRAIVGMMMIFYPSHWMPLPEPPPIERSTE